jgi:transcriptional regulator
MDKDRHDMIRGTLDLLILKVLSIEPMHGWGISERIQERSDRVLEVNQGALYPALHRLVRWGWIASSWRQTEHNRRARYYRLTAAGERQLAEEVSHWRRLSTAVDRVIEVV